MKKILLASIIASTLIGCNSSDDKNDGGTPPVNHDTVVKTLTALSENNFSNINDQDSFPHDYLDLSNDGDYYHCTINPYLSHSLCAEEQDNLPTLGALSRYVAGDNDGELINVYFNDPDNNNKQPPQELLEALDMIESIVGRTMFNRGTSSDSTVQRVVIEEEHDDSNYDAYLVYADAYNANINGGIIVSTGTYGTDKGEGYNCGNWTATRHGNSGKHVINAQNEYLTDSGFSWIHLPDESYKCIAPTNLIVHEFAHALGFTQFGDEIGNGDSQHFPGFGIDGMWDERAEAVLHALYNIPIGTSADQLETEYNKIKK
ncbi:hypothetical protein AB4371_19935 [Vibrio sp. 10N.261.51.A3]|uniref:hypothetical protein n=1 Tax=unclassified Vibrio TaxID=2614977 RepID=UPI00354EBAC1